MCSATQTLHRRTSSSHHRENRRKIVPQQRKHFMFVAQKWSTAFKAKTDWISGNFARLTLIVQWCCWCCWSSSVIYALLLFSPLRCSASLELLTNFSGELFSTKKKSARCVCCCRCRLRSFLLLFIFANHFSHEKSAREKRKIVIRNTHKMVT